MGDFNHILPVMLLIKGELVILPVMLLTLSAPKGGEWWELVERGVMKD